MNDEQLLQLLDQKTPEELTLEEIKLLHRRVADSPALRDKLLQQVEMEQYLSQALARVDVSADTLLKKAHQEQSAGGFVMPLILCLLCIGLIGFIGTVIVLAVKGPQERPPVALAPSEDETPDEDPATVADDPEPTTDDLPADEPGDQPDPMPEVEPDVSPEPEETNDAPEETTEPDEPEGPPPIWAAGLDAPPTPFAELWHRDFNVRKAATSKDDMPLWFAKVPGHSTHFDERRLDNNRFGQTRGIARLQAPWPEDAVLRLSPARNVRYRMHFWVGDEGVTIAAVNDDTEARNQWVAYQTQREPGKPKPKQYRLATVDDARDEMSELKYGPLLLIRWQAGELIVSRGDVELVSAPLAAPPEEVYFEGEIVYRGLSIQRVTDLPPRPTSPPASVEFAKPAELTWEGELPEGTQQSSPNNTAVRLTAHENKERAWLATELPQSGPRLVEVKLSNVTAPTGIYLGEPAKLDDNGEITTPAGKPAGDLLTFVRNHRDGQMVAWVKRPDNPNTKADFRELEQFATPYIGSDVWVRVLTTVASRRYWISSDGKHWAYLFHHNSWQTTQPQTHLGIYCDADSNESTIQVDHIALLPLPAINSLVDRQWVERAVTAPEASTYGQWLTAITAAQPADVDTETWRLASAVKTLGVDGHRDVTQALLDRLLKSPVVKVKPFDEQLKLLSEVNLLHYKYLQLPNGEQFNMAGRYLKFAMDALEAGDAEAFSKMRKVAMRDVPLSRMPFKALDPDAIRRQMLMLAYQEDWQSLRTMVSEVEFFAQGTALKQVAPLADWASVVAARQLGESVGGRLSSFETDWRHPLIEQYSKEGYNVVAELHAALDSQSYEDAARIVSALSPETSRGLLPARADRQLLRSVKTTIDVGMREYPEFKTAMNEKFGPLAKLRIRKAITAGDAEAIRTATVQFHGTTSLSEAYRWLGDRALSAGDFGESLALYRQSLPHAGLLERRDTEARMRLAAAMMGRSLGEPVTSAVRFGEITMTPGEFEALIDEMIQTHRDSHLSATEDVTPPGELSKFLKQPTAFKVEKKARFEGDLGHNSGSVATEIRALHLPWVARQIATTAEDDWLYVSNRFHVSAYNIKDGQRRWQSPAPPTGAGNASSWLNVPMKPLVYGDVVFARMLGKQGPVLACLDQSNGKIISDRCYVPPKGETLLSDPFPSQGRLLLLTLREVDQLTAQLRLTAVDLTTGQPVSHTDMLTARKRDPWELAAVVTPADDGFLATLGGAVVAFTPGGEVRWVRRQTWLPRDLERMWASQCYDPPLIDGEFAFVTQPCVRAIECVQSATGKLLWRLPLPRLQTMLGMTEGGLIAQTNDELLALDPKTGHIRWRRPFTLALGGKLLSGDRMLLTRMQDVDGKNQQYWPQLVWLNTTTGEEIASTNLEEYKYQQPRLAPLMVHGGKLWSLLGTSITDAKRDLVWLTPEGQPATPRLTTDDARWVSLNVDEETLAAMSEKFPLWSILSENKDHAQPPIIDIHGREQVVPLVARSGQPVVLARKITVPKSGRPRLDLKFGNDPNHNWQLRVTFGEELLHEQSIDWSGEQGVWKEQHIELNPVAGKSGWLIIQANFASGGDHSRTYWQQLDVKF